MYFGKHMKKNRVDLSSVYKKQMFEEDKLTCVFKQKIVTGFPNSIGWVLINLFDIMICNIYLKRNRTPISTINMKSNITETGILQRNFEIDVCSKYYIVTTMLKLPYSYVSACNQHLTKFLIMIGVRIQNYSQNMHRVESRMKIIPYTLE